MEINWEMFIPSKEHYKGYQTPIITLNHDNGRISLNAAVCALIENCYSYHYVEISQGTVNERLKKIRIQFVTKGSFRSIPVLRKKYHGSYTQGAVIHSKALVNKIYN